MAVQIFKPNLAIIKEQAQKAREYEQARKDQSKFKWGELEVGDNIIRPLPPTNSRGILGKLVGKHYFNGTALSSIKSKTCVAVTNEEVENAVCPICSVGDRILSQYPQLELGRWHRPGSAYFIQAVDRKDTAPTSKIYRLTPAVYNWLVLQVETLLENGVDLTDLNQGMDVKITKIIKQTKRGERTEYDKTLWNLTGVTPITTDQDTLNKILESMQNLDDIWKYPDDEGIADLNKTASDILTHFTRQQYQHPGAAVQVPGTLTQSQVQPVVAAVVTPQVVQQIPQAATPVQAQPAVAQPVAQVQVQPVAAQPALQPVAQDPAPVETPLQVAQQAAASPQQLQPASSAPATDVPACHGGKAPRQDGGVGYDDENETCLMCPHELTCMDACKGAA